MKIFNSKSRFTAIAMLAVFSLTILSTSSCRTKKEGCGLEEEYAPKTDRQGNLTTKKGSSDLFSKKMRKRAGGK